jgi:CP family cyanate transporter-like MFS transporter
MIALRTRTTDGTAALSGFVQSTGYLMSAVGPLGTALLYDITGSWTLPLYVLMGLTLPMLWTGLHFARPRILEDELASSGRSR